MKVAVFVSGTGTNLRALLAADQAGEISPAEITVVVCNRPNAPALDHARRAQKATVVVDHKDYAGRQPFEDALASALAKYDVGLIVLAGFMRILTPRFLSAYEDRTINIHPSLLPAFPGMNAQKQALEHGAKITGCTVHFVTAGVDQGPIILQAAVPILEGDDEERIKNRILEKEHEILPRAVKLFAEGRLTIEDGKVRIARRSRDG